MIKQKMADQARFDINVVFTMIQVFLAETLTGVQGDIRYKVLAALSTLK